jgi:class 3 adenylate cyclase
MTFDEILDPVIEMLQRRGRVSYRALRRQFDLDDAYLADLKAEIIEVHQLAADQDGTMLVWTGAATIPSALTAMAPQNTQLHAPPDKPTVQDQRPSASEAERRQLTVMFGDLVDSTRLARQPDPEDYRAVVRAYQQTCATVIQPFEGHIAQYLGDGLLVYFGYPQAHEDDAQRAVRAALGILEAIQTLNVRLAHDKGVHVAVRLGIHTGLVVVGAMGGGDRQEQLALGDTPNIAARLQGVAAADTLVLSEATYRLVQGYFGHGGPGGGADLRPGASVVPAGRRHAPALPDATGLISILSQPGGVVDGVGAGGTALPARTVCGRTNTPPGGP